ncbi:MAG TPA: ribonuclease HII [Candidatus Sulfotelmatobacter sp.]|nr:ribonuclease HII [Candidatus Sulfotelmatobacter sp.]
MPAPTRPDFSHERLLGGLVCGVDEAGRGPLAGPVVAAAVIFRNPRRAPRGIDDSKRVPAERRSILARRIMACAVVGIGQADVAEIERLNILYASMLAMRRAIDALGCAPDHVLVDGDRLPDLPCRGTALVGGDGRSVSIAAASIMAKVTRDALMADLARRHPGYGWEHNAGYGTPEHLAALASLGLTPHHRRGFAPVRLHLQAEALTQTGLRARLAPDDDASGISPGALGVRAST